MPRKANGTIPVTPHIPMENLTAAPGITLLQVLLVTFCGAVAWLTYEMIARGGGVVVWQI